MDQSAQAESGNGAAWVMVSGILLDRLIKRVHDEWLEISMVSPYFTKPFILSEVELFCHPYLLPCSSTSGLHRASLLTQGHIDKDKGGH
jgi:hypothetical protein